MKMKLCLETMLMLFSFNAFSAVPISTINVRVIGEGDLPIVGVTVQGYFTNIKQNYISNSKRKSTTDENGKATISGPAIFSVNVDVTKEGYYESTINISVNQAKNQDATILLRAKRKPIPIFAKHFMGYIPKRKVKIAFDFFKGDWVSPYGKGVQKDIFFYYDGVAHSYLNFSGELTISFPNETDGMLEIEYVKGKFSELKLPYFAPINGYEKSKFLYYRRKGEGISAYYEKNLNLKPYFGYFFRIRSERTLSGDILVANYVKIGGEIIFDPRSKGKGEAYIEMTYFLNPTVNDRNLEFDLSKNMFKNLDENEVVDIP